MWLNSGCVALDNSNESSPPGQDKIVSPALEDPKVLINSFNLLFNLLPPGVLAYVARSGDEISEILDRIGGVNNNGDRSNMLGDKMNRWPPVKM